MDLLAKLEKALEGMVEGVFSRAFKAPLQPVEVAKRLTREMEQQRTVSINTTYVPNVYTVHLAPETYQGFQAISGRLLGELEQYLRDFVSERGYQTVGPIAVRLAKEDDLNGHEIEISAVNEEQAVPSVIQAPTVLRSPAPSGALPRSHAPATPDMEHTTVITSALPATGLEITAGEGKGRQFPLTDGLSIGRHPDNTLALSEPGVSRHHAEIIWQDNAWVIRDLGSTNGTYVNNRRITTLPLKPGDIITIGQLVIKVK